MIRFISISLQNFLSYGANTTVIDLQRKGTTLILGQDLDNTSNGTGANGAGKTTIIEALVFGVYGKALSNISVNNLVNNVNKKNMEVTVTFEKDGTYYHIKRVRKGKGGNYIKFFSKQGSADFTDKDEFTRDASNTTEEIQKVIGMPYELFCRIVVFSATHIAFLDLPLPQQTKIIEELFALTILSDKATILKEHIKDSERSMEIAINKKRLLEEEHIRHDGQIESAKGRIERWQVTQSSKITALEESIKALSKIDVDKELKAYKDLIPLQTKIKEDYLSFTNIETKLKETQQNHYNWECDKDTKIEKIHSQLKKIEGVDIQEQQELQSQLVDLEKEAGIVTSEMEQAGQVQNEMDVKLDKKTKELEHLQSDKCPYCLQDFKDSKKKQAEVQAEIGKLTTNLDQIFEVLQELDMEVKGLNFKIHETCLRIKIGDVNELLDIKSQQSQLEQSLKDLESSPNPFDDLLNSFDEKDIEKKKKAITVLEKKEKGIIAKITQEEDDLMITRDNLKMNIKELQDVKAMANPYHEELAELSEIKLEPINTKEIDELDKLIKHQKFLKNLLTKKDSFIRKTLLDKNISFLNTRLQLYLNELGLQHIVEFTHDLTASITRFGKSLDFGNLSHGQQARVNIALSLSFRDLLESLHAPINVFLLDEVLDEGLDAIGVETAAKLIKRKTRDENLSTFIISHKNEIDRRFDRIMTVNMEDEFSFINEG